MEITIGRLDMCSPQTFIFLRIDIPLRLFGWPPGVIEIKVSTNPFHQAELIVTIQNLEGLRKPRLLPMLLQ